MSDSDLSEEKKLFAEEFGADPSSEDFKRREAVELALHRSVQPSPPPVAKLKTEQVDADSVAFRPFPLTRRTKSLAEMASDFAFFSPGILVSRAGYPTQALADFNRLQGQRLQLYVLRFPDPLFRGMGRTAQFAWDYILWAVDLPTYQPLIAHLCSSMMVDSRKKQLSCPIYQDHISVLDPLSVARRTLSDLAWLPIGVLGLSRCDGRWGLVTDSENAAYIPNVQRGEADPRLIRLQQEYFSPGVSAGDPPPAEMVAKLKGLS